MKLNEIYTISYSQPTEYRFSLDSIFLAQKVNEWLIQNDQNPQHIADVCAGCGVVGLELLFHLKKRNAIDPDMMHFIEVQNDYKTHFEKNKVEMLKTIESKTEIKLVLENYKNLIGQTSYQKKYELIICNPPYFHPGQGKLSPSQFKNRCRFFLDADLSALLEWIGYSLTNNGSAFLLVRMGTDQKSMKLFQDLCQKFNLILQPIADIRGTELIRLFPMT